VEHEIVVGPSHVGMTMQVTATDRAFPVSFGWHPWFRKPESVEFRPERMYRRDHDGITVDELVDVPPGPWDDCFVNRSAVLVRIAGRTLRLTSDCTDWVVYDEPAHATCIEPQTGPPDAFTIAPRILEPGGAHRAWYRIEIDEEPGGHRGRP
jgi:aldose 1-epimerase